MIINFNNFCRYSSYLKHLLKSRILDNGIISDLAYKRDPINLVKDVEAHGKL
jgi:hypothetical protein